MRCGIQGFSLVPFVGTKMIEFAEVGVYQDNPSKFFAYGLNLTRPIGP